MHDQKLIKGGALMGIAGTPVEVCNPEDVIIAGVAGRIIGVSVSALIRGSNTPIWRKGVSR